MSAHPDRRAATLAGTAAPAKILAGGHLPPGRGAGDCRIDLKLLQWRALRAVSRSAAARARLEAYDPMLRPDLWAGTVQDGVARGFAVALEEAIALAPPEPAPPPPPDAAVLQVFTGKELRKKRDLLVDSAGARVRFSRKGGLLLVDRAAEVHSENCLRFEARADLGTLDAFAPDDGERPRLFSAQFLQPVRYATGAGYSELELRGRLGRTARGFDCTVRLIGRPQESRVQLDIHVDNRHRDHRLRARFLGVPTALIEHRCTDVHELVENDRGGFCAFTLVRACGRLRVEGELVETPAAQCQGAIEHTFLLGLPGRGG
ncbi:MAG: hypothetical protein AB7O97_02755 [Planctomycetota bacterium]